MRLFWSSGTLKVLPDWRKKEKQRGFPVVFHGLSPLKTPPNGLFSLSGRLMRACSAASTAFSLSTLVVLLLYDDRGCRRATHNSICAVIVPRPLKSCRNPSDAFYGPSLSPVIVPELLLSSVVLLFYNFSPFPKSRPPLPTTLAL